MDAITLQTLYTSTQAANGRDTLPPLAHFATPIAADGKVFVGTQNSLIVYGLLPLPGLPDLTETSVTNPPATVLDGSSFSVTDSVQNIGNVTGAASTARYYLSTTTSKSGARLLTGSRAVPSLASSATSSGTVTVTVSAGTAGGTYFLLACADDTLVVPETNESNNCKASATQDIGSAPVLAATALCDRLTTAAMDKTFSVSDIEQNIVPVTAHCQTTRSYLSTTTFKLRPRLRPGIPSVPSFSPSTPPPPSPTLFPNTAPFRSTYFLLACADDTLVVPETNESNNCKASATQ